MTQPPHSVKEQMPLQTDAQARLRPELRKHLLQLRRETSLSIRQTWDLQIATHLRQQIQALSPRSVGIYWPIKAEPNLQACFQQLHADGVQLALPIVTGPAQALKFVSWAPEDAMDEDAYGIPIPRERTVAIQPDLLVIPCVGFNLQGFRLGYGGGFYDRTLAAMPKVSSIGVAYQISQSDFPLDKYDLPLGQIITELGIVTRSTE